MSPWRIRDIAGAALVLLAAAMFLVSHAPTLAMLLDRLAAR